MNNLEIDLLVRKLEQGIQEGLELHQRWLNSWFYFPLRMCCLGGNSAQQFARSHWHVVRTQKYTVYRGVSV